MAVLNFLAHKLYCQLVTEGYEDDNGDYHEGEKSWEEYCMCDIVPAGRANTITTPDGNVFTYSYTISNLPYNSRDFEVGEKVKIAFFGKDEVVFTIKGFHRYQMQCKIWV